MDPKASRTVQAVLIPILLVIPASQLAAQDGAPDRPDLLITVTLPASGAHGEFELTVHVDSLQPFSFLLLQVKNAPTDLEILGWRPGDSLASQIEDNGEPPACDIIIYPDRATLQTVMLFRGAFSSEDYGTDYHIIRYRVKTEAPKTVTLKFAAIRVLRDTGTRETFESTASFDVEPPSRFLRGDSNADSQLNVGDPMRLLGELFLGDESDPLCEDAADANNDGRLQLDDVVFTLQALFLGTVSLPFACEPDTGTDFLRDCEPAVCRES